MTKVLGPLPLLRLPPEPRLLLWTAEDSDASTRAAVHQWREAGLLVRRVRGSRMRTVQALFDETAAALQFPWYFGSNHAAFDDCITDLEWLPTDVGRIVLVSEALDVLVDDDGEELAWFVSALHHATAAWAHLVDTEEFHRPPPLPFHVVLQAPLLYVRAVAQRWSDAGAVLHVLS